jgi:hypothetical protein
MRYYEKFLTERFFLCEDKETNILIVENDSMSTPGIVLSSGVTKDDAKTANENLILGNPLVSIEQRGKHPIIKYATANFLSYEDRIEDKFHDTGGLPVNAIRSLLTITSNSVETIRIDAAEDTVLSAFIKRCHAECMIAQGRKLTSAQKALQLAKLVTDACGGAITISSAEYHTRCKNFIAEALKKNENPICMLGTLIDGKIGVGRHRALLFKYISDLTYGKDPIAPLRVRVNRGIYAGKPHVWNVVLIDGENFALDLERNPQTLIPVSSPEGIEYIRILDPNHSLLNAIDASQKASSATTVPDPTSKSVVKQKPVDEFSDLLAKYNALIPAPSAPTEPLVPVVAPMPASSVALKGVVAKPPEAKPVPESVPTQPLDKKTEGETLKVADANKEMQALQSPVQSLNPGLANSPSVEECDAARVKVFEQLGVINRKMLVGETTQTCPLYIIHRPNGNVALATRGLANPSGETRETTGFGLEIFAEAGVAAGSGSPYSNEKLGQSYLFQMMHEVAGNIMQIGEKLRQLIDIHECVSMELNNVDAPPLYTDPHSNRTCVLLKVSSVPREDTKGYIPEHFLMPGGLKVKIVTVRLLTFDECLVIRRFGKSGRKALVELFNGDKSYHVAPLKLPKYVPESPAVSVFANSVALLSNSAPTPASAPVPGPVIAPAPAPALASSPAPSAIVSAAPPSTVVQSKTDVKGERETAVLGELNWTIETVRERFIVKPTDPLPPLDVNSYNCPVAVEAAITRFVKPTPLTKALSALDIKLLQLKEKRQDPRWRVAIHILDTFMAQTKLVGWRPLQDYINNPTAYINELKGENLKEEKREEKPPVPTATSVVSELQALGQNLTKRYIQRVNWILDLQKQAGEEFDPDLCLIAVAADKKWIIDSAIFVKEVESKIETFVSKNLQRFAEFKDLHKRGARWPHSPQLLHDIAAGGFEFRPTMVLRDKSFCRGCGLEVVGWRPWHHPQTLHLALGKKAKPAHEVQAQIQAQPVLPDKVVVMAPLVVVQGPRPPAYSNEPLPALEVQRELSVRQVM